MKIQRYTLQRGSLAIVITEKEGAEMSTVVLHTAYTVADRVEDIHQVRISDSDNYIYICGHGNLNNKDRDNQRTISNLTMGEIAELLIKAGYRGKQDIFITSCHSDVHINGNSMVHDLNHRLLSRLIDLSDLSDPSIRIMDGNVWSDVVFSHATGSTVTVEEWGTPVLYVVTSETKLDDLILAMQSLDQKRKEKRINLNASISLPKITAKIGEYKNLLVAKEHNYRVFHTHVILLSLLIATLLALTTHIGYFSLGYTPSFTVEVLVGLVVLLACDIFGRSLISVNRMAESQMWGLRFGGFLFSSLLRHFTYVYLIIATIKVLW